ncbi:MAG TPA: glycoside hydrolase family 2 TIM barrel-domain containing protein, partial [Polyangiaceae bacterium]|nr:glycoside hydrolase family 2 TIM barrel-domain containing protein [Polyangiaceae bacterium]
MARTSTEAAPRERICFNADWRFLRGDAPDALGSLDYEKLRPWLLFSSGHLLSEGVKRPVRPEGEPGTGISFVKAQFDDSAWRKLTLPHDFGIEGPFSQELPGDTGKLPWHGVCWYRKRFALEPEDARRRIALDIDGAMSFSAVWLNGRFVGGWPFGYSSFRLDLTPHLDFAGENVLAIRLDNPPNSSRWYPGGGLYRNVWLSKTKEVRVAQWGTFASTPRVTARSALVSVDVTLENLSDADVDIALSTAIFELGADEKPRGKAVAKAQEATLKLTPGAQALRTQCAEIVKPKLWTLKKPRRYLAVTSVHVGEMLVDRVETAFGVRTIRFDAKGGFSLNGKRVELQGVCMHHDLGALGSAINERALERQIEILQAMGANAIRTSHNPPAPELLDLCDRMGMLVMDEAFDCWRRGKRWPAGMDERDPNVTYFDYATVFDDWHERDLRALIRRDRNHPSVVIYSIGNEVIEQWYSDGWKLSTRLAGIVREEDRSRPITAGLNSTDGPYSGFQTAIDVAGYNYKPSDYIPLHKSNPALPIVATETASCISSRGEYFFPV